MLGGMRAIAIAFAVALAAPGTAGAATKVAKFKAEVSGSQVTNWIEPRHMTYYDCFHRYWTSGAGRETVSFRQKKRYKVLAIRPLSTVFLKYGTWDKNAESPETGVPVKAEVNRWGYWSGGHDPGDCGGTSKSETDDGEDCGGVNHDWVANFDWRARGVTVDLADRTVNPLMREQYDDCPIVMPSNAPISLLENNLTPIEGKARIAELFNKRKKRIVVNASRTFSESLPMSFGGAQSSSVEIKWRIRLTRVR